MSTARPSFKFRGGSFHALVVRPESPIEAWLADVDVLLARSPGFFAGKSVVIDVSGLSLTKPTFLGLLDELSRRDIRILGVEGANPADVDGRVPSLVRVKRRSVQAEVVGVWRSATEVEPQTEGQI
jgi:septum site-determining protein MinC